MTKQKVTLTIDKEIVIEAKKLGINISNFVEVRLIDYIQSKVKVCSRRGVYLFSPVKKFNKNQF